MFLFIVNLFIILATVVKAIFSAKRGKNAKPYIAIDIVLMGISLLYLIYACYFLSNEWYVNYLCALAISVLVCVANILNFDGDFEENGLKSRRAFSLILCGMSVIFLVIYCIFGGTLVIDPESKVQDIQYITAIRNDDYVVLSQDGENVNMLYVVNDNGRDEYINKVVKKEDISINENSDKPCITTSKYYYKKIGIFGNEKLLEKMTTEKVNINVKKEKVINSELLSK